ncbi:EamA family transporter [Sporosarcina sp. P21c]|uniref:EamA family transporter n=1 Tax=Sporosarcina sp. P21c TaxID=2048255 RepID=UPI001E6449F1|nr:EamA family transporter [Sporosarcina sp. P21c]
MEYSSPVLLVAWRFTIAGAIMVVVVKVMKKTHPKTVGEWKWLVLIGSLQTGNPERTSVFLFLAPFFGTLSGWILLDEKLSMSLILGGLLISLGDIPRELAQ